MVGSRPTQNVRNPLSQCSATAQRATARRDPSGAVAVPKAEKAAGREAVPDTRFDSEGLLALPELNAVAGRRVVIFRGEEGRRLLAQTLAARGAQVHEVVCYRRRTAVDQAPRLVAWLAAGAIAVLTATSRAGVR